jgi:Immunity protein Imm1
VPQLTELLTQASRHAETSHTIAELVSPAGAELTIGLGRDRSFATFKASPDPPYFVSHGPGSPDETLVFFYGGPWSEFTGDNAIATENATAALREFYETGRRPTGIAWTEV